MCTCVNFAGVNFRSDVCRCQHVEVNDVDVNADRKDRPYHHGDLRNALVQAAADLAEAGGPEAVTLRAAARVRSV